jgi:hypothetical protein
MKACLIIFLIKDLSLPMDTETFDLLCFHVEIAFPEGCAAVENEYFPILPIIEITEKEIAEQAFLAVDVYPEKLDFVVLEFFQDNFCSRVFVTAFSQKVGIDGIQGKVCSSSARQPESGYPLDSDYFRIFFWNQDYLIGFRNSGIRFSTKGQGYHQAPENHIQIPFHG